MEVTKFLPHRKPFLLIDRWIDLTDEKVTTSFEIKEDCIFLESGYLQEAGLVENAAQTCSSIIGKSFIDKYEDEEDAKPLIGFISSIKRLQVNDLPPVGATLISKAELVSSFDTGAYCICGVKCLIFHDDICLLDCELNLIIQETI